MLLCCDVDRQVQTDDLDQQVHQDWMVSVDWRGLEVSPGLEAMTVCLVGKALQVDQVQTCFEIIFLLFYNIVYYILS